MLTAYQYWDMAPEGTSFTLDFPPKFVHPMEEGVCMDGVWTFTKIPVLYLLKFRENDPALVIPLPSDAMLIAIAHSKKNPHKYFLTRRNIRRILEWAERENAPVQIEE